MVAVGILCNTDNCGATLGQIPSVKVSVFSNRIIFEGGLELPFTRVFARLPESP